ncbi:MAG: outer membrane beta-barrel protein [bacterium]
MKRTIGMLIAGIILVGITNPVCAMSLKGKIGFGGNYSYLTMNMQDAKDWFQNYKDFSDNLGRTSELKDFKVDPSFSADIRYGVSDRLVLSLGYSSLSGKQEMQVTAPFTEDFNQSAEASGILGSVLFIFPNESTNLFLGGGLGSYSIKFRSEDRVDGGEVSERGKASQMGYHLILGLEHFLSEKFAISLEGLYRILKISEIECTESTYAWSVAGDIIKKPVDYNDLGQGLEPLELDFTGFAIGLDLHFYL